MSASLTNASLEALRLLAFKPRRTYRMTLWDYISGASAAALVRRGFARYEYDTPASEVIKNNGKGMWDLNRKVIITEDGRRALRENAKRYICLDGLIR